MLKVIEHKFWRNVKTGRKISLYGAAPWTTLKDKDNWEVAVEGWTWFDSENSTVGCHRVAAKTKEEADEYADKINAERAERNAKKEAWLKVRNAPVDYEKNGNIYTFPEVPEYRVEKEGKVFWVVPVDAPNEAFWLPNLSRVKVWMHDRAKTIRAEKYFG